MMVEMHDRIQSAIEENGRYLKDSEFIGWKMGIYAMDETQSTTLNEILEEEDCILLLGQHGSGKTTMLQMETRKINQAWSEVGDPVAFFINLKMVRERYEDRDNHIHYMNLARDYAQYGPVILFADALDEVTSERSFVVERLKPLLRPNIKLIVSCRETLYNNELDFPHAQFMMKRLTDKDITSILNTNKIKPSNKLMGFDVLRRLLRIPIYMNIVLENPEIIQRSAEFINVYRLARYSFKHAIKIEIGKRFLNNSIQVNLLDESINMARSYLDGNPLTGRYLAEITDPRVVEMLLSLLLEEKGRYYDFRQDLTKYYLGAEYLLYLKSSEKLEQDEFLVVLANKVNQINWLPSFLLYYEQALEEEKDLQARFELKKKLLDLIHVHLRDILSAAHYVAFMKQLFEWGPDLLNEPAVIEVIEDDTLHFFKEDKQESIIQLIDLINNAPKRWLPQRWIKRLASKLKITRWEQYDHNLLTNLLKSAFRDPSGQLMESIRQEGFYKRFGEEITESATTSLLSYLHKKDPDLCQKILAYVDLAEMVKGMAVKRSPQAATRMFRSMSNIADLDSQALLLEGLLSNDDFVKKTRKTDFNYLVKMLYGSEITKKVRLDFLERLGASGIHEIFWCRPRGAFILLMRNSKRNMPGWEVVRNLSSDLWREFGIELAETIDRDINSALNHPYSGKDSAYISAALCVSEWNKKIFKKLMNGVITLDPRELVGFMGNLHYIFQDYNNRLNAYDYNLDWPKLLQQAIGRENELESFYFSYWTLAMFGERDKAQLIINRLREVFSMEEVCKPLAGLLSITGIPSGTSDAIFPANKIETAFSAIMDRTLTKNQLQDVTKWWRGRLGDYADETDTM